MTTGAGDIPQFSNPIHSNNRYAPIVEPLATTQYYIEPSTKVLVDQLVTMVPIFVPPEGDFLKNEAVKIAYDDFMIERAKLVAARDHLDILIRLAKEQS